MTPADPDDGRISRLRDIVGEPNVLTGDAISDAYTHDEALTGVPVRPLAVVRPAGTAEVAAVVRTAAEFGMPVTARGSGTGLSGACTPRADGIVCALDRMQRIVEIDLDNHCAVVEAGVTLDQLDEATAPHGLVYPVYPGETSASLGGNVATNAGGMRAVKYGVTRHQVLGLEAVLATGEVIRTGGKFVKATTGYDLTQLIIGSEGTLAIVTEAILKLYPRPAHNATVLAPFRTLGEVSAAVPRIVNSGVDPLILEYIDALSMAATTANVGLDLGIPSAVKDATAAYLVVVVEQHHGDRLDDDAAAVAALLADLGALDVYALPPHSAALLLEAREKAFWVAKQNGANDIIDVVVPRASVPEYLATVAQIAEENATWVAGAGHAGDGNVHLSVFQGDDDVRSTVMRAILEAGMKLGGAISAEHGIGTEKKRYFLELEDPAKIALMRRIKAAFDPQGILNPGTLLDELRARSSMNGAHALIRTLVANGVDVCFANPGTSEMQFVAALDDVPEMRAVLTLFEGVATGAADGYGRMAGRPAATLLHLGPGLGNGIANLHNARRARTPIVNIVGDQATYHRAYDAPLTSDIDALARNVSGWIRDTTQPQMVSRDAADAVVAASAPPGCIATLILPADTTWLEAGEPAAGASARVARRDVPGDVVDDVAKALRAGEPAALLLGGAALQERALVAASRVANATAAKLLSEVFPARLERGAGLPPVERLGYFAEFALAQLDGVRHLVLVDTTPPVSFFAYPDKPSLLVPDGCEVHTLALGCDDVALALEHLADALGAPPEGAARQPAARPGPPSGALSAQAVGEALGAVLPEGAIVADEAQTGGLFASGATAGVPPHDWLTLTGGAIGLGLPLATGAAVACPDRKVVCLEADGSAMYTLQALWTQAREGLDVTTILFDNRSYAILNIELSRVGAGAGGPRAQSLLDLTNPDLDFVALAKGMGVEASRPETADELVESLSRAIAEPGPHLIDVPLPARL